MKIKELLELVKNNSSRGSSWPFVKGNRAPGRRQIELLKKHKIVIDVDPKIRNLVIGLNELGFKTWGSCAGHTKRAFGIEGGGFVTIVKHKTFSYEESQKMISKLCKKNGIPKVTFDDTKKYACKDGTNMFSLEFKSLGNFLVKKWI